MPSYLRHDVALAAIVTAFAQLDLRLNLDNSQHYGSQLVSALVTLVITGVLVFRRRAPVATAVTVAVAVAGPELFTQLTFQLWGDFLPILIAAYSVARYADRKGALIGAGAAALALAVCMLRLPALRTVENLPFAIVPYLVSVVAGRGIRHRQRQHDAERGRAERLAAEREESIRAALAEERGRIARELHDIVAHCVSVMVVQAGAAEDLLDRDPEAARAPLRSVQETGRDAVGELSRMLGLLRRADLGMAATLAPQPGIAELSALVEQVRAAGLPVQMTVDGEPRPLPPGVELTAYRVVQEALTNTLKHGGPARASVAVCYADETLTIEVIDTGRSGSTGSEPVVGTGHGLLGMRERVGLYDGELTAGPRSEGGFGVKVELPLEAAR
ncbi:sensor histidine kinase [Cryptosporangium phraense]|uniref:histidine kinase n=1 Tax=Cryptosporangium phraense TaxID=2593070 RepID=A0A545ALN4_9ACTN|nr:sensor histidine kinase [Cryptosporangium phraense]TQS42229.1 sensor histidine kinase [Cryptosporangium phraense]